MKKNIIFKIIILLFTLISLNSYSQENTALSVINQVIDVYNQLTSFSCCIEYSNKSYSSEDTIKTNAECNILKFKKDTSHYQLIWYTTDKDIEIISLSDKSYKIIHGNKTIYQYLRKQHQENVIRGDVLERNFLHPEGLLITLNTNSIKCLIESFNGDSISYWTIRFKMPNQWGRSDIQKNLLIEKKTNFINKIETMMKYQGNYQYNKWEIKNLIKTNLDYNIMLNRIDSLLKKYTLLNIDSLSRKSKQDNPPLNIGIESPSFSGYHYQERTTTDLRKFNANLILLDFWYMACPPCIQAIKGIEKLYNKYKKNEFLVLGINSNDDYKNEKRLNKFLKYNEISYPLLFVDKSVDSLYQVKAYPTFYLIGKDGKVIYSSVGFNESVIDTLEFYIKKHLNLK